MTDLSWSWLALPYVVCTVALVAVALVAALIRGDRVMRLGVIGSATTAMPWALCSALVACTDDPVSATKILRVGSGPVALIGPNLLLVLLAVGGQLERQRWLARIAGLFGAVSLAVCWGTDWVVPGVHRLGSGVFYISAGPLTDLHISQIGIWLFVGLFIARQSMMRGERRRMVRGLIAVLALATLGSTDTLLVHDVAGVYPVAWLSATITCVVALYLELKTDLLRPQGFDRAIAIELAGFGAVAVLVAGIAWLLAGATPVAMATIASLLFVIATAATWAYSRQRAVVRVAGERALEQFLSRLADIDDERQIASRLAALWKHIALEVRTTWRARDGALVAIGDHAQSWQLAPEVAAWLAAYGAPLASADLATMRLGPIRPAIEALVAAHDATLIVPLLDRGVLVGLVEADHEKALRDGERQLVAESARAAARSLTYIELADIAAREGATAREVEVAEAMRLSAVGSGDDELGRWAVAAEYKSAARTTGATWSAVLLGDGRLAVLVTEAHAHGVAAALATAALTGAFAAATTASPALDDLLASLRASAETVLRGGEPIAAFVAIVDDTQITWACAGHPGAVVITAIPTDPLASGPRAQPIALGGGGARLGEAESVALRGEAEFSDTALLVIASTGTRGDDEARWHALLREHAPAGTRLAALLVDAAAKRGPAYDDLLAVVVRLRRTDRRSQQLIA